MCCQHLRYQIKLSVKGNMGLHLLTACQAQNKYSPAAALGKNRGSHVSLEVISLSHQLLLFEQSTGPKYVLSPPLKCITVIVS